MTCFSLIQSYFPAITEIQQKKFDTLVKLYGEWNEKVNLISRKDIVHLPERHVLHSLGIAKVIRFQPRTRVLDIGTGGGFPGIPLAILFPDVHFHLVDSVGKKIRVVQEISKAIGLENTLVEQIRAEEVKNKFDYIVCRAVAPIETLRYWTQKLLLKEQRNPLPNGYLMLKGGDLEAEKAAAQMNYTEYLMSDFFDGEFFLTKKVIHAF